MKNYYIVLENYLPITIKLHIYIFISYFFLQEPNPEDPLNQEAADVLQGNRRLFEQNVIKSMRGGYIGSTHFECCLK